MEDFVNDLKRNALEELSHVMNQLISQHEDEETRFLKLLATHQADAGYVTYYQVSEELCGILEAPTGTKLAVDRQFPQPGTMHIAVYSLGGEFKVWSADYIGIMAALTRLKAELVAH